MVAAKHDRVFLVEKTLGGVNDAHSHKGTLPHLETMTRPDEGGKGYVVVYTFVPRGILPVKAFLEADRAEAFCKEREDEAWEGINPFRFGSGADWTNLDAGRLRDLMLDIGLEPPMGKFDAARW